MRGLFIVFEGLDGSGKGTQIVRAMSHLFSANKSFDVYVTREPTRGHAELRRRMLASRDSTEHREWYARGFIEDREYHVREHIEPALSRGTHVLSDRYKGSTVAYQGAQGLDVEDLARRQDYLLSPDLTIVLDCSVEVANQRRSGDATEVFDMASIEFQSRLRENYLRLPELLPKDHVVVVDARDDVETVASKIGRLLDDLIRRTYQGKDKIYE